MLPFPGGFAIILQNLREASVQKHVLAILAVAALVICLFAGCNSKQSAPITDETSQNIALEDAGLSKYDVAELHAQQGHSG